MQLNKTGGIMRNKIFIVVTALLIATVCGLKTHSVIFAAESLFKAGSEPNGFNGIKWGTDIATLNSMEHYKGTSKGTEVFLKKNENLAFGEAKLERIEYHFVENKLEQVIIIVNGFKNWDAFKKAVFDTYGLGLKGQRTFGGLTECYDWRGQITDMGLGYNPSVKKGSLFMIHTKRN